VEFGERHESGHGGDNKPNQGVGSVSTQSTLREGREIDNRWIDTFGEPGDADQTDEVDRGAFPDDVQSMRSRDGVAFGSATFEGDEISKQARRPSDRVRKDDCTKQRQTTGKDDRQLGNCWYRSGGQSWLKVERFEVRGGAKRGDKGIKLFDSIVGKVEFLDSIEAVPELGKATKVVMVDVDCEQLTASVRQDHVEEWGGRLFEVNGGPQGRVAKCGIPPLSADAGEREQGVDTAIRSDGVLKDLT